MALMRPDLQLSVDGRSLSAAEAGLFRAHVRLSVGSVHDQVELSLWQKSKFAGARVGAELSLSINGEDVFAGEVVEAAVLSDGIQIEALAKTVQLSRKRVSQAFTKQKVADIVQGLVGSVEVDEVEGDAELAAYSVDDRRTVWAHLIDLARLVGAELGSNAQGALRFVLPATGSADTKLRYGAELVGFRWGARAASVAPQAGAFGAGSEAGQEKWHWILKEPEGIAGGDGPVWPLAAFSTRDAAEKLGEAWNLRAERRKTHGMLAIVGNPKLRAGDLVETTELPDAVASIVLRLTEVRHLLDPSLGFFTFAKAEGVAS